MRLLVSDANILIDMEEGQLLTVVFKLPFELIIPDLLFFDELEELHPHWLGLGLKLGVLSGESVRHVSELTRKYAKPSRNDCMALALAKQEKCPLLTGDRDLKKAAELEGIFVSGTLWLVEQLVIHSLISVETAKQSYERMKANGRRLPWDLAMQRLDALQESGSIEM